MNKAPQRLIAVLFASALSACSGEKPDSAEAIIRRHVAARGGAAALDAIHNVDTKVLIEEASFTVNGDYRASAEGLMRIDIDADNERVFSEGVDADGAWRRRGGGDIEPASEKGEEALRNGVDFNVFGLHRFAGRGHSIALDDDETVDGVAYKVLKVTLNNGFETWLYVNPESFMIERRRDVRALHPDVDANEKQIESVFSDFTDYCGVIWPRVSRLVDMATGETMQTATTTSQRCNLSDAELRIGRNAE